VEPVDEVVARRIGQTVGGKWKLERLLGTGGMAAVYAARADTGEQAAIKILHPEMSIRRDVRERFLREAYVANKVGHPGAVRVEEHFDGGEEQAYLVMELLTGESLSDRVRRHGKLPLEELLDYLDQVLDVLVAAHAQGIVHRDLKPDNLFVTNEGRIKVLDFGVARLLHDAPGDYKTRTGMALGTLPYMAPEQALGRRDEIDGRADLFSMGATAFRILAGRKVHEAHSDAELLIAMASKPAQPLASVAPDVAVDVCAVVDLALAFSKDARYPDARTMQSDVRAVRSGQPPPHARSRLSIRDQATRADMPAVLPVAGATPAVRTPTVAMPAPPPSSPRPIAVPAAADPTAIPPPSGPVSFVPVQRTVSIAAEPPPASRRSSLPLFIALGALGVAVLGGAVAWATLGGEDDAAEAPEPRALDESQNPGEVEPAATATEGRSRPTESTARPSSVRRPATERSLAAPPSEKRGRGRRKGKGEH
jgi:serine/threonine-protein kinase